MALQLSMQELSTINYRPTRAAGVQNFRQTVPKLPAVVAGILLLDPLLLFVNSNQGIFVHGRASRYDAYSPRADLYNNTVA